MLGGLKTSFKSSLFCFALQTNLLSKGHFRKDAPEFLSRWLPSGHSNRFADHVRAFSPGPSENVDSATPPCTRPTDSTWASVDSCPRL